MRSTKDNLREDDAASSDDRGRSLEIIHAAAHLFHENGFHATSMNDIAKAMNLTKPGLYHYVKSKEELLYSIIDHAMNMLQDAVINPAKLTQDPGERLELIIEQHARLVLSNKVLVILADEMAGLSPEHHELVIQHKRDFFRLLRGTLDELVESGRIRSINSTVVAFAIFGALLWL
ncbi:MAG: TetR/AcrR family transcriptional regulator, partial [Planctomyces sp.]